MPSVVNLFSFLLFPSGMWYSILEFLNVAGVVTNSFLVAFTSSYGRSWEGDLSTSNRTNLVFNSTSNTTETVFIVTEHLDGPSKLWLIIGFEVSPSFRMFTKNKNRCCDLNGRVEKGPGTVDFSFVWSLNSRVLSLGTVPVLSCVSFWCGSLFPQTVSFLSSAYCVHNKILDCLRHTRYAC